MQRNTHNTLQILITNKYIKASLGGCNQPVKLHSFTHTRKNRLTNIFHATAEMIIIY